MPNPFAKFERSLATAKAFIEHEELAGVVASAKKTQDLLEKVATAIDVFADQQTDYGNRATLRGHSEQLNKIASAIGTGVGAIGKFKTIASIYLIMRTLSPESIRAEPDVSAALFGELFVHCGDLAESLPPPANSFAPFLQSSGTFFTDMYNAMNLESPHTTRGRMMIEVLKEIDKFGKN